MGNIEITKKFSRLGGVSNIDDDYYYSFTSVIYLSLYNYKEKQWSLFRWIFIEIFIEIRLCNRRRMFLKSISKSSKYTWWSLMYQF